jgi:DNA ligase 1
MEEAGPEIEGALLRAIAEGGEGLMLKFLDSRCMYEPSKRADSWLKLKKDYCEGLRDSLDLVSPHNPYAV